MADPYKLCWCCSGAKFKFCHHRREDREPINFFDLDRQMRALSDAGYCLHPEASQTTCSAGVSKAHTVQRHGGLGAIAEDGHVLTVKPTFKGMIDNEGVPSPRLIGVSKASVFPGFCGRHDTLLFKPVEGDDLELTAASALRLGFRAISFEHFHKAVQLKVLALQRTADYGKPFEIQVAIQQSIYPIEWGTRRGLADTIRWKATYDQLLQADSVEGFHYCAVRFDRLLSLVACGAFHVEFDFDGRLLQRLTRGDADFEHVAFNITSFNGCSVVVLCWTGADEGPAAAFAESFRKLDDELKADACIRIAFEQTENIFLSPSWWAALAEGDRQILIRQIFSGTPQQARTAQSLIDRGTHFAEAQIIEATNG